MANRIPKPASKRNPEIFRLIRRIRNKKKRNLLRGYSSQPHLTPKDIEAIRDGTSVNDAVIAGAIIKGRYGFKYDEDQKKTSKDLYTLTSIEAIGWRREIAYSLGLINSLKVETLEVLSHIETLSGLPRMETTHALNLLLGLSKEYGASNYLSYKLAYIRCSRPLNNEQLGIVAAIEDEVRHTDDLGFLYSALENVNPQFSLFVVAQRRISGLVRKVDGEFRKAISLSNFIPTPIHKDDISDLLLRASESCLIDTIYSIIILYNVEHCFEGVKTEIEFHLDESILRALLDVIKAAEHLFEDILTKEYLGQPPSSEPSMELYRASSAFLEAPRLAKYRIAIDRVFGARLLQEILGSKAPDYAEPLFDKSILLLEDGALITAESPIQMDSFYRTNLFLRFISHQSNLLALTGSEIQYLFENTFGLDTLLSESEMRMLILAAPESSKKIVAVLALALFRKKSVDLDVDFEFREQIVDYVKSEHGGSIPDFIDNLLSEYPRIASYLVEVLDEVTLEKMYTLITSTSHAADVRCQILRAVGKKLNRIEFFIEADAISTKSKLSELMTYFDSSRMYVDGVAMTKWLDSNPTVPAQEYKSLYTQIETQLAKVEDESGEANVLLIEIKDQDYYLIAQIAKDAFKQFCLNTEFGVESYLGRRIRHNTLDGVTKETVDAVLQRDQYKSIMTNPLITDAVNEWLKAYTSIIDHLRKVQLQFDSVGSLFTSKLNLEDQITKKNIRTLTNTLRAAGGCEVLNDLLIGFCWHQITPQLEAAARLIKTDLLKEAQLSIDKYLGEHMATLEKQLRRDLHEAVNEVFKKIADWFQVPQTGFVSASIRDLCTMIRIELGRQDEINFLGDVHDKKYTGSSVHRLYDCLAVLIQNAHKHGKQDQTISIRASEKKLHSQAALDLVRIDIFSTAEKENYKESKNRVLEAVELAETGIDMVTEGYTGIKKVKYITRNSEGQHTVEAKCIDETKEIALGFALRLEPEVQPSADTH